ncbi:AAA family ATPase [Nonomuraea ceibae]|uniref:AAA family ATPase n=1 Tax=Nonomuraea ceibae TaxID=1935170 RepID=UPI001C5E8F00|nr:AAA family ATPase [Nonomuraea ceibae]
MDTGPGPRLILLCGLPGAGKTTPARRLERRFSRHAEELLRLGQTVVLEFGFWTRAEREEKRDPAA